MNFLRLQSNDVYQNLATEEYFLTIKQIPLFMLWINDNCIVLGRNQNSYKEINQDYVEKNKIKVVRRMTGGGAVFQDKGNLNFTFIQPHKNHEFLNFKKFLKPIIKTLDKLGVKAQISGRNDVLIDGKKFSGNAQYIYKNWIIHHGTIMFSVSTSDITKSLNVHPLKIEAKGLDSIKSRVTNISEHLLKKITLEQFSENLLAEVLRDFPKMKPYHLTIEDQNQIEFLRDQKYSTWAHNFGQNPQYELNNTIYIPTVGLVDVYINVEGGIIKDIKIYGDFFSKKNIEDVEKKIVNTPYERDTILKKLVEIKNFDDYFNNLKPSVLVDIIIGQIHQQRIKRYEDSFNGM